MHGCTMETGTQYHSKGSTVWGCIDRSVDVIAHDISGADPQGKRFALPLALPKGVC